MCTSETLQSIESESDVKNSVSTFIPQYQKSLDDVTMTTMASQITSLRDVYSIVYSDADQRKHQSSASLAFMWWPVTGEFPAQMASYAENVSIWWRHYVLASYMTHREYTWRNNECMASNTRSVNWDGLAFTL